MSWNLPVSIKGVIFNTEGNTLLLKNGRDTWELAGGRLEKGEQPEQTLIREIHEELGIEVTIEKLINCWVYEVLEDRYVLIITYLTKYETGQKIALSAEHEDMGWFSLKDLDNLSLAEGYKSSIRIAQGMK